MVRSLDCEGPELNADSDAGPPPPSNLVCPKTTEHQVDPQCLKELLDDYPNVFRDSILRLPPDRGAKISIPLQEGTQPLNRPIFRYSPAELEEVQAQVEYLLQRDLIIPNTSSFGAQILFVKKPNGTFRMCVDYRALNKATIRNQYPIPRVDDLLDQLRGAKVFSAIDLMQGYYQIKIQDANCAKTAFKTPMGLYKFRVLPFGLMNAPVIFQCVVNRIFRLYIGKFVLVYLDDILVFSKSVEEHLTHIRQVLNILRTQRFYARLHKCHFNQTSIKYLGHIISANGI